MPKLTEKQHSYVECRKKGMNLTDSYRESYDVSSKSDKYIYKEAFKLENNPKIAPIIAKHVKDRAIEANFTSYQVLSHLSEIILCDVSEIFSEETYTFKPLEQWPKIWRQMVEGVSVKERHEGHGKDRIKIGEEVTYKFMSKTKALELVGKHVDVGAFAEKIQHEIVDRASVLERAKKRAESNSIVH